VRSGTMVRRPGLRVARARSALATELTSATLTPCALFDRHHFSQIQRGVGRISQSLLDLLGSSIDVRPQFLEEWPVGGSGRQHAAGKQDYLPRTSSHCRAPNGTSEHHSHHRRASCAVAKQRELGWNGLPGDLIRSALVSAPRGVGSRSSLRRAVAATLRDRRP
jgi:hypothetical protein